MARAHGLTVQILAVLIGAVVGLFGFSEHTDAAVSSAPEARSACTYVASVCDGPSDHTAPERGPPTAPVELSIPSGQPSIDSGSRGTWARPRVAASHDYDLPVRLSSIDNGAGMAQRQVGAGNGRLSSLAGRRVAAKAGTLSDEVAGTFRGGRYTTSVLREDTVLYRAGTSGKEFGQYFSTEKPVGVIQTRIDKAIPPSWPDGTPAPLDTGFAIRIPKGNDHLFG
jgi:hypothetical protein